MSFQKDQTLPIAQIHFVLSSIAIESVAGELIQVYLDFFFNLINLTLISLSKQNF